MGSDVLSHTAFFGEDLAAMTRPQWHPSDARTRPPTSSLLLSTDFRGRGFLQNFLRGCVGYCLIWFRTRREGQGIVYSAQVRAQPDDQRARIRVLMHLLKHLAGADGLIPFWRQVDAPSYVRLGQSRRVLQCTADK